MNHQYVDNLFGALALAVTDRTERALEDVLQQRGSAGAAMLSINTRPNETIDDLARVLGLSHSATVRVVDRLQARGWVLRRRAADDSRAVVVALSSSGRAIVRRLVHARQRVLNDVTRKLTAQEMRQFGTLVSKLLTTVPTDRADARHVCRLCEHSICRGTDCPVGSAV